MIPPQWEKRVEGAPIPEGATVIGDWIVFADATVGKLDQQYDRTISIIHIVQACEARDAAAVKTSTRRRLFGIPLP